MREWFDNLAPRERLLVTAGAVAVALLLFWSLVMAPLDRSVSQAAERVATKRADLAWMRSVASELTASGIPPGPGDEELSLVVLIDRSAGESGLRSALTRNQPEGPDGIRVRLEGAPFDPMMLWLSKLQASYGLTLESATFERAPAPGAVNASIVLRQPG